MSRIVKDYAGMIAIGLLFVLGFGAIAVFLERESEPEPVAAISAAPVVNGQPDLLVDVPWLLANEADTDLIIDLSDQDVYDVEHIPGAVHVWYQDAITVGAVSYGEAGSLSDPNSGSMTLDYSLDTRIVVYDTNEGERASRFLWLLRASGFANSWMLDGGLAAWKGAGQPTSAEPAELASVQAPVPTWDGAKVIVIDELGGRLEDPALTIIDSRTPEQQRDTVNETIREGKLPGSWSIPSTEVMREDGTFRSPDELRALFAPLGLEPGSEIVVYGRWGTETGRMWLALNLAGFQNVRIFEGWFLWAQWPDFPIEPLGTQPEPVTPVASPIASPVATPIASPVASPVPTT